MKKLFLITLISLGLNFPETQAIQTEIKNIQQFGAIQENINSLHRLGIFAAGATFATAYIGLQPVDKPVSTLCSNFAFVAGVLGGTAVYNLFFQRKINNLTTLQDTFLEKNTDDNFEAFKTARNIRVTSEKDGHALCAGFSILSFAYLLTGPSVINSRYTISGLGLIVACDKVINSRLYRIENKELDTLIN